MIWHRKSSEVEAAYNSVKGAHAQIRKIQNELAMQICGRPAELKPAQVVSSGLQHILRGNVTLTPAGPGSTIIIDSCLLQREEYLLLGQKVLVHIAGAEGARTANYLAAHCGYGGGLWDYEFTTVEAVGEIFAERSLGGRVVPRRLEINWKLLSTDETIRAALHCPYSAGRALYSPA